MRKILVILTAIAITAATGGTVAYASNNYYSHNGQTLPRTANTGLWLCYRSSSDYLGLVNFFDYTGDATMGMLDGRGSCLEEMPEDVGMDIGSRLGPVMFWSGNRSGVGTYKWSIRQDGSLVPLNGTRTIGVEGGFAHFGNPTIYAEDIRTGSPSWSLVEKIQELEARIAVLEAQ